MEYNKNSKTKLCKCGCGETILAKDSRNRIKKYKQGHQGFKRILKYKLPKKKI